MGTSGKTILTWLCGVGIALAAACGSVSSTIDGGPEDDAAPTGDFTLAVAPQSLSVPIASSGTVTLTVARTGTTGPIMLASQNAPAGVTVAFATNPLPEDATSTEVTLTVAGGTAPATAQITFTGSAGISQRTATLAFSSTTIAVAGFVRDEAGSPRGGVTVGIVGKPVVTTTNTGAFSFTDVTPPYDLYTVAQTGNALGTTVPAVIFYDDLTALAPTVRAPSTFTLTVLPLGQSTVVSGTVSGVPNTTNPLALVWTGPNAGDTTTALTNVGGYGHTLFVTGNTTTGRMMGFQFTRRNSGAPDVFSGFGQSSEFTVNRGVNLPGVNVPMNAVANTGTIVGSVTAPNGYPVPTKALIQQFGATTIRPLWTTTAAVAADATYPLVATAGRTALFATSSVGSGADEARTSYVYPLPNAPSGPVDVALVLPAPAVQTAPIPAATNVTTSTSFTWTSPDDSVDEVRIVRAGNPIFTIYTRANTITIPVIPQVPLAPNAPFTWGVQGYGPYTSMDEAVTARHPARFSEFAREAFDGPPRTFTNSTDRTFTSAQ